MSPGDVSPGDMKRADGLPDHELAERLVADNLGWLQGWLRGRVRDPELVHDICQEAMLKALRSASKLRDPKRFSAWLYRIAENTLRDHLRRQARRRRWLIFSDDLDQRQGRAPATELAETHETADRLLEAIRGLPPRYREPFLLKHTQDLPYAEIARILGISENAVQVRLFRARKMLARKLGDRKLGDRDR